MHEIAYIHRSTDRMVSKTIDDFLQKTSRVCSFFFFLFSFCRRRFCCVRGAVVEKKSGKHFFRKKRKIKAGARVNGRSQHQKL